MPAISLGVTEIVARLRHVQRRWNGVALQHAVYLSGSLVALGTALLIVLALRGPASTFASTFWVAIVALVVGVALAARRVQHNWLSLERVARRVDHTAGLDERLSTIVGCGARLEHSPVGGILVRQLVDLAPRWTPTEVAPRRVPRSVWLFIVSLCALATTAFLERRPPAQSPLQGKRLSANAASDSAERMPAPEGLTAMPDQVATGSKLKAGEDPADGAAFPALAAGQGKGTRGDERKPSNPQPSDATDGASMPDAGMVSDSTERQQRADAKPADGVPERLQDMIREAFGAKMLDKPRQLARANSGERAGPGAPPEAKSQDGSDTEKQGSGQSPNGTGQESRPGAGVDQRQAGQSRQADGEQGGSAPRAGGAGDTAGTLFGAQAMGERGSGESKTFQLKLSSFGNSVRLDTEPQAKKNTESVPTSAAAKGPAQEAPLNERQSADDPLQKGAIPPEHEATVRQIFSLRE